MGGGSGGLPTPGNWKAGAKKLLDPRNPLERARFLADPGGLVYTSGDEDIAAWQAKGDIMNIGAKSTSQTREAERIYESEVAEATKAAKEEAKMVEAQEGIESERKRRSDRRRAQRISRGSLLTSDETQGETLG